MRFALIACRRTPTNDALAAVGSPCVEWQAMTPADALENLRKGDVALGRLDVLPSLDGMDEGLWALGALAARGVVVLNDPAALLAAHDKLLTARLLRRKGLPHPRTIHVRDGRPTPVLAGATVVKPRFGSWGRDVRRCDGYLELEAALEEVRGRGWYRRHGALVQELVPTRGYDLRVLVAADKVVGAVYRIAAPGEWRTNIALGGVRREVAEIPREAGLLAVAAARAAGMSLVGVDLLPLPAGGWTVIELNGAVEFTHEYAPWGDVFSDAAHLLAWTALEQRGRESEEPSAAAV